MFLLVESDQSMLYYVAGSIISLFIFYFIIKGAVKSAIIEANNEIKIAAKQEALKTLETEKQ